MRWEDFTKALKEFDLLTLKRKHIHNLNKISNAKTINRKTYWSILQKKAPMLCYSYVKIIDLESYEIISCIVQ